MNNHNSNSKVFFWVLSNGLETWKTLSTKFSRIVQGKLKDDDFGFVDTQPRLVNGQGIIFLQETLWRKIQTGTTQQTKLELCS